MRAVIHSQELGDKCPTIRHGIGVATTSHAEDGNVQVIPIDELSTHGLHRELCWPTLKEKLTLISVI